MNDASNIPYQRRQDLNKLIPDQQIVHEAFRYYNTSNLKGISAQDFYKKVTDMFGRVDYESEGYIKENLDKQRDLTVTFTWGHNHDFGDFQVRGAMGDRHIAVMANFVTVFPISLDYFRGKKVFDIGCWTGGTSLLLGALGSNVFGIDEVRKYADTASFLARSFDVGEHVNIECRSLYSCNFAEFHHRFDIVYFPGVIYHLSDPVLALRIIFNSLKIGGIVLIESAGINTPEPYCQFWGNKSVQKDAQSGWAWFWPSPSALGRMMKEAGFDEIDTLWLEPVGRVYGYGKKTAEVAIVKAGLSVPDIL